MSGKLYNYCWACSVWQWGLGCFAQAAQSPNCQRRLVPDTGLTILAVMRRCKWMACSSAGGGHLKCEREREKERDTSSAHTQTRANACVTVCYSTKSTYFSVATVARRSPPVTNWRSAFSEKGEGMRDWKEGEATDLSQEDIHLYICLYTANGWRQGREKGEAGHVCVFERDVFKMFHV